MEKKKISVLQLDALKPFDWSNVITMPPRGKEVHHGSQILHFTRTDKHYTSNPIALAFVKKYLKTAKKLQSDAAILRYASDSVNIPDGFFLEMGVCTGKTINFIAALNPSKTVYGFDSFEGLPEAWVRADNTFLQGTFGFKGEYAPSVLHNVVLYKGLFKNVLPKFKKTVLGNKPIALLHIDSDIYSSAKDVFEILGDNIVKDTIIVFDELYNYPGYEEHEWKAFQEFLQKKGFKIKFLAFNENHEQVAVKILGKV